MKTLTLINFVRSKNKIHDSEGCNSDRSCFRTDQSNIFIDHRSEKTSSKSVSPFASRTNQKTLPLGAFLRLYTTEKIQYSNKVLRMTLHLKSRRTMGNMGNKN